jgi:hypothetical protein
MTLQTILNKPVVASNGEVIGHVYDFRARADDDGIYGLSHIMADSCQIMWRKFLRSLCKYNAMEQPVLPHNVAWPFSAFLPSWCYALFAATLCGRKRVLTLNLASILREMVLPDNMALSVFSHIFLWTDTQSCRKHVFGRSRHIM